MALRRMLSLGIYSISSNDTLSGEDAGVPMILKKYLRVVWYFDEGGGEQICAPGIGPVKATSTDEQYPFSFILIRPPSRGPSNSP